MMGGMSDDATARTAGARSAKTNATPLTFSSHRDELGLNAVANNNLRPPSELRPVTDHDDASVAGSIGASSFGASTFASSKNLSLRELAKEERRRAKRARKELEEALANLPAPQFEYELAVPEDVTMEEADEDERAGMVMTVKDKADEDAEELERLRKEAERLYEEQSSVMKRSDLPRPKGGANMLNRLQISVMVDAEKKDKEAQVLDAAEKLIHEEMATLINHDAHSHPILPDKSDPVVAGAMSDKGGKKDKRNKKRKQQQLMEEIPEVSLDYFPEESLESAKRMLDEELKGIIQEKRDFLSTTQGFYYENDADVLNAAVEQTLQASCESASGVSFSMDKVASGWKQADKKSCDDTVTTLRAEYAALQGATKSLTKACAKLEHKLHIQTGGYTTRSTSLIDSSLHSFAELQHSRIEQSVYTKLRAHETKGVVLRTERLQEEVERLEEAEMDKQRKYGELMHEKNRLLLRINSQGKKKNPSPS